MNCENIAHTFAAARPDRLFSRPADQDQPESAEEISFGKADDGQDIPLSASAPTWPRVFPGL